MVFPGAVCRRLGLVAALTVGLACSGGGSGGGSTTNVSGPSSPSAGAGTSDGGASPSPSTSPAPSVSPTPTPSPTSRPPVSACPYGKGTLSGRCDRDVPAFLDQVDEAIDQLVQQNPGIFRLATNGSGMHEVLDQEAFWTGVVANLQAMGFCANWDFAELQVKNGQEFSEQYDILLASGHIRRGDGSYRATCTPAVFPVEPADFIKSVRVAFFGIECKDGRTPPRNGEGLLPVGCVGYVTASPKDADNEDVDERITGHDIEWTLPPGNQVRVDDFPHVEFNKTLTGMEPGKFSLCATVLDVQGCLHGEVIP